jgi:NTE family protein
VRVLDEVDVVTGVSGGSFTALAYGLHGDKLFDTTTSGFLKRDVEGLLLARVLSPANWGALWSAEWGRSELASQLYDEILFEGATFRDLQDRPGPLIVATATDISTGSRPRVHAIGLRSPVLRRRLGAAVARRRGVVRLCRSCCLP